MVGKILLVPVSFASFLAAGKFCRVKTAGFTAAISSREKNPIGGVLFSQSSVSVAKLVSRGYRREREGEGGGTHPRWKIKTYGGPECSRSLPPAIRFFEAVFRFVH